MNPDDYKVMHSIHAGLVKASVVEQAAQSYANHISSQRREYEREQLRGKLRAFRESYIKIRTDNIALDHQSAIELTKLIYAEADSLTYEDIA